MTSLGLDKMNIQLYIYKKNSYLQMDNFFVNLDDNGSGESDE